MAMEAATSSTASARPGLPGVIVAATIGNVLEWFDFLVYGFFAVTIAEVFFPAGNPTVSLPPWLPAPEPRCQCIARHSRQTHRRPVATAIQTRKAP